jgi:hypothetical protein
MAQEPWVFHTLSSAVLKAVNATLPLPFRSDK